MGYTRWELPENEQRLREAVAQSASIAQVARAVGIKGVGGNYRTLKHHITRMGLDTSHHTGQAWNRENYRVRVPCRMEDIKKRVLRSRGHVCQGCGLTEWRGQPIPLELEHRDGDRSNNEDDNLELLCCNCHAQTPTWRRRKTA